MNGKKLLAFLIAAIVAIGMASCAQEGPGMSNVENVNSALSLDSLVVDPEVDLYDGSSVLTTSVHYSVEISVDQVAPEQDTSTMTGIHFTEYEVDYASDDPDYSVAFNPIEVPIQAYVPPGDNLSLSGYLAMPGEYKQKFVDDSGFPAGSSDQIIYEFSFTFYGENQFGQEVEVKGSDYTLFGDF
ncbi:MAG: hypothetical protein R6V10_00165 [bacterium]